MPPRAATRKQQVAEQGDGSSNATEQKIMKEAARLFRTKGFEGTSTRMLASAIGIQSATLYYYMTTKEDLLFKICLRGNDLMIESVGAAIGAGSSPVEGIRAAIAAHLGTAVDNRDVYLTTLSEIRALSPRRRREVMVRRDEYWDLLADAIARAQEQGEVRRDLSSDDLMVVLRNLLSYTIFSYTAEDSRTIEELADLMAMVFFEGARA